jgi:hypothetical protein
MTSAGAGEKSVQDTHIHRGAHKELLDDGGGEHTCTPFLPAAAENQKIRPAGRIQPKHLGNRLIGAINVCYALIR